MSKLNARIEKVLKQLETVEVLYFKDALSKAVSSFKKDQRQQLVNAVNESFNTDFSLSSDFKLTGEVLYEQPTTKTEEEIKTEVKEEVKEEQTQTNKDLNEDQDMNNTNTQNVNQADYTSADEMQSSLVALGHNEESVFEAMNQWASNNGINPLPKGADSWVAMAALINQLHCQGDGSLADSITVHLVESSPYHAQQQSTNVTGRDTSNTKWVAFGGAVIGAGLEHLSASEVKIGSVAGGVAGCAAAYFGTEKLIDLVGSERNWLNLSMAGTIGLLLGGGGSKLGRTAQDTFFPKEEETVVEHHTTIHNYGDAAAIDDPMEA